MLPKSSSGASDRKSAAAAQAMQMFPPPPPASGRPVSATGSSMSNINTQPSTLGEQRATRSSIVRAAGPTEIGALGLPQATTTTAPVTDDTTGLGDDSETDEDEFVDDESASKGGRGSAKRAGFIETLYSMVHAPENEPAIGFAADGMALEIRNTAYFSGSVLPKHFNHRNVSSFIRQLNNYGFRTIPSPKGIYQTFVHDNFLLGRKDLIKFITRRVGVVVKKRKTLYEQVVELKQRDVAQKQRIEELEQSEYQKNFQLGDLENRYRMLMEERDALVRENQRLILMLGAPGSIPHQAQGQLPAYMLPSPRQHPQQSTQQHLQPPPPSGTAAVATRSYRPQQQHNANLHHQTVAATPWHHHQQQQSLFEPVSGPNRSHDPTGNAMGGHQPDSSGDWLPPHY